MSACLVLTRTVTVRRLARARKGPSRLWSRRSTSTEMVKQGNSTNSVHTTTPVWWGPRAEDHELAHFGMKLSGGGAHLSKTMMFRELDALISTGASTPAEFRSAALDQNTMGKATANTRRLTFNHLASLYGLTDPRPLTKAMLKIWSADAQARRLVVLLVALARDPLLRESATTTMKGSVGQSLRYPSFHGALLSAFPERFSGNTLRSLAQNCASSWTQSGHLNGAVKKLRQRVIPTPSTVAFAALIATACGFGGPAILSSGWMRILDLGPDQALDALRRAESVGLARVRSAGDVTEISVRQPMAYTLGVPELEHV